MIPWKLEEWNGFYGTDYKKETFFSRLLKKKGRRKLHLKSIYTRRKKKWNKSEKEYGINCILLPMSIASIFFQECFVAEKFKTGRTLRRKVSIILTPRSSTCLLRNTKPGTLYKTRALLTLLIFLEVWNKFSEYLSLIFLWSVNFTW